MKLETIANDINSLGACETEKALRLYQKYICISLNAVAVTWSALYRGSYGRDSWHTIAMDKWKVFDIVFPEGMLVEKEEARSKFFAKAKKEGGLGPGIVANINAAGSTRAHLIGDSIARCDWKKHWEYALLLKQGIGDRMTGAYYVSDISESHVWVDRAVDDSLFESESKDDLVRAMNRFPRLHRWIMLERGLVEPATRPLSPRERQVLKLLLGPWNEREIAEQLEISQGTVHNHITAIYKVFGVSSRYQLVQLWIS